MKADPPLRSLAEVPLGAAVRVAEIRGGRELVRRLLGLGLRLGSRVTVVHRRGRGLVVSSGDVRIALGGGIAEKLWVELEPDQGQASPAEPPSDESRTS